MYIFRDRVCRGKDDFFLYERSIGKACAFAQSRKRSRIAAAAAAAAAASETTIVAGKRTLKETAWKRDVRFQTPHGN